MSLASHYIPHEHELKILELWQSKGIFSFDDDKEKKPIGFVLPPPNITGRLHIGHALNATLQDILFRWRRMQGYSVLWQPGVDHASIAAQAVVERSLKEQGKPSRQDMGREAFLQEMMHWKEEHGSIIEEQLRRLGASCDFRRSRFTMDEDFSRIVCDIFIALYEQGFIYKAKRLVNWDWKLGTAISDLEVLPLEVQGHLYTIRYPLFHEEGYLLVATTRPETLFGDVALAVHSSDERYAAYVGKRVCLPLTDKTIPILADNYVKADFASGVVKITPAHDFNDFKVAQRHDLELINIFTPTMHLNENVPAVFQGLSGQQARKSVVQSLQEAGLIEEIKAYTHMVPHGDRSHVTIEPFLTDQWYVDAPALARASIEAVHQQKTTFLPPSWEKNYFEWMEKLEPWCISRQLWWGHQIPVWYAKDEEDQTPFLAKTYEEAQKKAADHFKRPVILEQESDVLDTWFSSALWPFAALEKNCLLDEKNKIKHSEILQRYYPIDTLITSFDIIFFWVARMMMMGVHFLDNVPFHRVFIHALIRDEKGQKMSKSKGNVIDPLSVANDYGTDAMRMCLAALTVQGRDIKLSLKQVEGWRNFVTKLWNTVRFCLINQVCFNCNDDASQPLFHNPLNQWIMHARDNLVEDVTQALDTLCFNEAIQAIYHFTRHIFCDWYVEGVKNILFDQSEALHQEREEVRLAMGHVLTTLLKLLHPFAPFVTETIWQHLGFQTVLLQEAWPAIPAWRWREEDPNYVAHISSVDHMIDLIMHIRSLRAYFKCQPGDLLSLVVLDEPAAFIYQHMGLIKRLARLSSITQKEKTEEGNFCQFFCHGLRFALDLGEKIDLQQERHRLEKDMNEAIENIKKMETLLSNERFLAQSKSYVIEEKQIQLNQAKEKLEKLHVMKDAIQA